MPLLIMIAAISAFFQFKLYSQQDFLQAEPKSGDGIRTLLKRYGIDVNSKTISNFKEKNSSNLTRGGGLILGRKYTLPVQIYRYNGTSIRTTIGNPDWDNAVRIRDYNDALTAAGIKPDDYRNGELWVPVAEITGGAAPANPEEPDYLLYPVFGPDFQKVKVESNKLEGYVFYVVAGHGGPDPGAVGYSAGNTLHEDEYAYDVSLRLARRLLEMGAKVYTIVEDPDDGIRDMRYLNNDKHEIYNDGSEIPLNQLERLRRRAEIVDKLYNENAPTAKEQIAVMIHVDSRITRKRIDIFFYHAPGSSRGETVTKQLLETMEAKYRAAQPGRGYDGSVSGRHLYMLRKTKPVGVYIELGNIQNPLDQVRILEPNNRQAIANWLTDGFIEALLK